MNAKTQLRTKRLLLLLENLRQGFEHMRLLDVKLGAETSVACWKGKSRLNAWKNACVDQRTNSAVEGFRLEGIELPPRSLEKRISEVLQSKSLTTTKYISPKVIRRFTLQRLRAVDFLESWLDVSHLGLGAEPHAQKAALGAFEQMRLLLSAVCALDVPQQWIGSSVALAMEVGSFAVQPHVAVKVFDWGRAELNTASVFNALPLEERESRTRFWKQYLQSLARMYWELGRMVAHRCCCPAWSVLVLELRAFAPAVLRAALLGESLATTQAKNLPERFAMKRLATCSRQAADKPCFFCCCFCSGDLRHGALPDVCGGRPRRDFAALAGHCAAGPTQTPCLWKACETMKPILWN